MNTRMISRARRFPYPLAMPVLAVAMALGLSACGGGGGGSGGYTPQAQSQSDRRVLPQDFLTNTSVNYSPYRTSTKESELVGEAITPGNVLQDLRLIQAAGIGNIRLFSSRAFAGTVLEVIRANNLKLKVQLGAYPNPVAAEDNAREAKAADPVAEADNQAELDRAIQLANAYKDIVAAVSVGNEVMVEWSTHKIHPDRMAGYLRKVRGAITQPVTTNDNFLMWSKVPQGIAEVIDFAAVHVYPFLDTHYNPTAYDWRQKSVPEAQRAQAMLDASVAEAKKQFAAARAALDRLNLTDLPMVIGETGWAAVDTTGGPNLKYRAHPVNQKMYFDALQAWVREGRSDRHGPKAIFYFQAFDEPWKLGDDGWGLFNTNREARYVLQGLGTCGVTWACEAGAWTLADAVKWVEPVISPAITSARFTIYADTLVAGEVRMGGLEWDGFEGVTAGYRFVAGAGAPGDGGAALEVVPTPLPWGWGLIRRAPSTATENLSAFANGKIRFSVRSDSYPGKVQISIGTDTEDGEGQEAKVLVGPGDYGYCNTNAWCDVSIPLSDFLAANPKLDLRMVTSRFAISDIFGETGKPQNQGNLPPIRIDGLHWSQ